MGHFKSQHCVKVNGISSRIGEEGIQSNKKNPFDGE